MPLFRIWFAAVLIGLAIPGLVRAGMNAETKFTERGQTDFDTFLQLLNPYGTWSKIDGLWAYTPTDHGAPYTDGRWLYTEYGWYWKGARPHSWATEHYGYWKRSASKVWSWYPGPFWLPETIEMRRTATYIGWRSAEVDDSGSFVEAPLDRYTKFDEWSFVTLAHFANPITPAVLAAPNVAQQQLDDSTDCRHTYLTYREIDRPGPHPADVIWYCKDGGMLAPKTIEEEASESAPKPPPPDANTPAAHMTGTNGPVLMGAPEADGSIDPRADTRKVKYWVTMSLPTFWTKPPEDASPDQIFIYRPDMYQDADGIERRITLWFNPNARTALKDILNESPSAGRALTAPSSAPSGPAVPAVPAEAEAPAPSNPFSSPLDQPFHAGKVTSEASGPSNNATTNTAPKGPAPTGLK
jgi:hypothetical protein